MALISGANLSMRYGPFDIFEGVNISLHHGERAAIVGPNGQGKTTLLRILAKDETPVTGEVFMAKDVKLGFLRQDITFQPHPGETLWALAQDAFADVIAMGAELAALEEALGSSPDMLEKYGHLQTEFELAGGYEYQQTIKTVFSGLGFSQEQYHQPIEQFSGGQQTRAHLARLLLQRPNVLLLDEPTNHLDLAAIEWLETYLANWRGAVLVVSHDRYFLDKVVNRVFELSYSTLEKYRGTYSAYVEQRAQRIERQMKEYAAQQKFIAKEEDFIQRNLAGQRTKEAQGRRKRLERLKRDHLVQQYRNRRTMHFKLATDIRSGDMVIATHDLQVGYPDGEVLFSMPNVEVHRGDCIALLGANGSGKTSFLRTLLGELPPKKGAIRMGAAVEMAYFAQIHTDLNVENNILDELLRVKDNMTTGDARSHLARFLFTGEDVFKSVGDLSGGERSRLALAKFVLSGANFLILDEPTNHLDIPSQEILEMVLKSYNGTILLVSHDRYFINALASHIWFINNKTLSVVEGNYDVFSNQNRTIENDNGIIENNISASKKQHLQSKAEKRAREKRARELSALEATIEQTQEKMSQIEKEMEAASLSQKIQKLQSLAVEYQQVEKRLADLLEQWVVLEAEA